MTKLFLIPLIAILNSCSAIAQPTCLQPEPTVVSITGTLKRMTFPGRPNYESIKRGDEAETGFYMVLKIPICTTTGQSEDQLATHDVRLVQLVLDAHGYAHLRPMLNKQVTVDGHLFAAHTGHHHAPLLLQPATR